MLRSGEGLAGELLARHARVRLQFVCILRVLLAPTSSVLFLTQLLPVIATDQATRQETLLRKVTTLASLDEFISRSADYIYDSLMFFKSPSLAVSVGQLDLDV